MGFIAVTLASVNIFGGFIVTQRMLSDVQEEETLRRSGANDMNETLSAFLYLVAVDLLHHGAARPVVAGDGARRQLLYGIVGMVIADRHHAGAAERA